MEFYKSNTSNKIMSCLKRIAWSSIRVTFHVENTIYNLREYLNIAQSSRTVRCSVFRMSAPILIRSYRGEEHDVVDKIRSLK